MAGACRVCKGQVTAAGPHVLRVTRVKGARDAAGGGSWFESRFSWVRYAPPPGVPLAPISIAGQTLEDGVKTFGSSTLWIDLGQKAKCFTALVRIDDEAKVPHHGAVLVRISPVK